MARPPKRRGKISRSAKPQNPSKTSRQARAVPAVPRLIALNKPFNVLSQFSDGSQRATLADFVDVPDVYPAGRLDRDSEGLLLLTNDGRLQARIADPAHKMTKRYWAQVEGEPSTQQLDALRAGPVLNDGPTQPAQVQSMAEPALWLRHPPVRYRKTVPTTWLQITIGEGRNRQVRRMTAAVGLPTLRLVRMAIGHWALDGLQPGEWRALDLPR